MKQAIFEDFYKRFFLKPKTYTEKEIRTFILGGIAILLAFVAFAFLPVLLVLAFPIVFYTCVAWPYYAGGCAKEQPTYKLLIYVFVFLGGPIAWLAFVFGYPKPDEPEKEQ